MNDTGKAGNGKKNKSPNQIFSIFAFTFLDGVRKKAFIISTVIIVCVILGICVAANIAFALYGENIFVDDPVGDTARKTCYYIDDDKLIAGAPEMLASAYGDMKTEVRTSDDLESLRALVKEDGDSCIVYVTEKDGAPFITVIDKNVMTRASYSDTVDRLSALYIKNKLSQEGVPDELIAFSRSTLPSSNEIAGSMDITGYTIGLLLTMLIFFAVYYYGYGVANSIATEKSSRVMETLLVCCKPSKILLGKCLGMGVLGLSQFVLIIVVGALSYSFLIPDGFTLLGMELSLASFTLPSALLIILYFLLGYALYAMLNSMCGALVSKIEDLNSAMMPVVMLTMAAFYLGYFVSVSGIDGIVEKVAMYFPFSAPFIVPFKLLNSDVTSVDIIISVSAMLVFIVVISFVSMKIYSASVMHYGKRLKLKEAYRQSAKNEK